MKTNLALLNKPFPVPPVCDKLKHIVTVNRFLPNGPYLQEDQDDSRQLRNLVRG